MLPQRSIASPKDAPELDQSVAHSLLVVLVLVLVVLLQLLLMRRVRCRLSRGDDEVRAVGSKESFEAPESLGLIRDMFEKRRRDFVHTLTVTHLGVVKNVRL